jgi:DNA-binding transcriptional regulator YiaG
MQFAYMSARDFKRVRIEKGYSQAEVAREFGVNVITVSRWEREAARIPRMAELALSALKSKRKKKGD